MKYLRSFYENKESIEELCKIHIDGYISDRGEYLNRVAIAIHDISYVINNDDSVTIIGNGNLSLNAVNGRIPIKIQEVGTLFLHDATTLENSPNIVKYAFNIGGCRSLTSLENGPKQIGSFLHLGPLEIDNFSDLPRPLKDSYQVTTSDMYLSKLLSVILKPKYNSSGTENGYYMVDNEVCDNIEIFTDFDPIRPNQEYSLNRLNQYLEYIGKEKILGLEYWKNID